MSDIFEFKCPSCGAAISFDADEQKMVCPYCDTELDLESMKQYDDVLNTEKPEDVNWQNCNTADEWNDAEQNGVRSYVCTSCGGEIIGDINTAATTCPYCGNPAIISSHLSGQLKPDLVIPFKINKDAAKLAFKSYLKGKILLPDTFKSTATIDSVMGVYVPFWLYDCDADASIRYKATTVSTWADSRNVYTKTSHYCLVREGSLGFDKVPVDGSIKMDDTYMQSLEPFNYDEAVDFQTAYLAGYLADKYDLSSDECSETANARIKNSTVSEFGTTTSGYATCETESASIQIKNAAVKYALLPVWVMNAKYNDKNYQFMMNGQTGKFVGNLPTSVAKAFAVFAAVLVPVSAIAALIIKLILG